MRTKNEEIMQKIVDYINERYFAEKIVPSVQEIANYIGMHKSNISRYLVEMEEKGMISRNGSFYGISTVKMQKMKTGLISLPIVGDIACGTPILAEENIESYITLSIDSLGGGEYFALKAKGKSMIGAGIDDGDYVIVKSQDTAEEGQIIVALIDNEATLKRYYIDKEKQKIRLHPENSRMKDMYYDEVVIQGVAKKVIKNIN